MSETSDWNEYKISVLDTLKRIEAAITSIRDDHSDTRAKVVALETKLMIAGTVAIIALGGCVTFVARTIHG